MRQPRTPRRSRCESRTAALVLGIVAALGNGCASRPAGRDGAAAPSARPDGPAALFPPGTRSLELRRSTVAYTAPSNEAPSRGTVAARTRVRWLRAQVGPGCEQGERWVEIIEDGWVCDRYLEPSPREPFGIELPRLDPRKEEIVPGEYAVIAPPPGGRGPAVGFASPRDLKRRRSTPVEGAWKCLLLGDEPATIQGQQYWRTDCGLMFPLAYVRKLKPATFEGVRLEEASLSLPVVFVQRWGAETTSLPAGGLRVRRYPGRTALAVHEIKVVKQRGPGRPPVRAYRVGEREWLPSTEGNLAAAAPPPAGLLPGERWVDVDTDEQVLVAYEGERPVFATLVSTGKTRAAAGKEPTPTTPGVYRIYHKFAEAKMSGLPGSEDAYYVSRVPWTQYFAGDLALHAAYWHDGFGHTASHGCVNLAPKDARFLYFWTDPPVPLGWSMMAARAAYPGSVVRVRNAEEPDPELKGYARTVLSLRQGKATAEEEATEAPAMPVGPGGSGRGSP